MTRIREMGKEKEGERCVCVGINNTDLLLLRGGIPKLD